ncbi:hypothetical protein H6G76_28740 [Nostoc sp. FACHB-152]|uniref:hypothetical protein n=1 Tax=unclassified Nostoc TaxID=2593658 RepID=UPI0016838F69|nr:MULTISPECIES: hypothetical protein [unclassified Nostoc]MBD2451046.1 hypothetical protein [Nostoc sp. FACHB-152]MBD2471084.1 hypothetical protein [Nostoc sp. FACHB-145]
MKVRLLVEKASVRSPDSLKVNFTDQGDKLLGGKYIQGKLMSKVPNLLFTELFQIIP